jgi:hypothetical protein
MQAIRDGLHEIVEADRPMSVRQVFYQAVTRGLVEKTELAYNATVGRLLLEMRRDGTIPYSWIADGTRWMRKPSSYTGLAAFIERHQDAYRRDPWAESDTYLEVWCEKDALAGVIYGITAQYDVPLMISRGFASESYLHSSAEAIDDEIYGEPDKGLAVVYYFGDFDPSGLKIGTSIEAAIRRILTEQFDWPDEAHDMLEFRRVAVTEEQIEDWALPTRPTKVKGNAHAADWTEDQGSVELDAIPAGQLRALVRDCIELHVDHEQLIQLRIVEAEEREQLALFGQQVAAGDAP